MKYNMIYERCYGCLDFLRSFMAWWSLWIEIDYWIYNKASQTYWQGWNKKKNLSEVKTNHKPYHLSFDRLILLTSYLSISPANRLTDWLMWSFIGFYDLILFTKKNINCEIKENPTSITKWHLVKSVANMFISCKKYKCSQNLFIFFVLTVASCIQITNICHLILTPSMGVDWLS